jgi:hypothetical protein
MADGQKLKVFISYSRKDSSDFADELVAGLELGGFAPFLDRHDIAAGEDWEARLGGLIQEADTVVYVISPEAMRSERCAWEVNKTLALSKRLIPVIYKPVSEMDIPCGCAACNLSVLMWGWASHGRLQNWHKRSGKISFGLESTHGSLISLLDGKRAADPRHCYCAMTISMLQRVGLVNGHRKRQRSRMFRPLSSMRASWNHGLCEGEDYLSRRFSAFWLFASYWD